MSTPPANSLSPADPFGRPPRGAGAGRGARAGGVLASAARFDLGLLAAAAGLTLIGILLTWSATARTLGAAFAYRGVVNAVVGLGLAFVVLRLDPRTLRALVPVVYAVGIVALLAVLSPLGSTVNGSRSWIQLPSFSIQPAEVAKVALALALAWALADSDGGRGRLASRDVRLGVLLTALPLALIMAQPDLGSALVVSAVVLAAFVVAGLRGRYVALVLTAAAAVALVAVTTPVLAPYQRDRLLAFVRPDVDPTGIGYQVAQVKLAIGSGGVFGQGLFAGASTQGGFVPFQYTDFVFSVAGEELGFVGAFGIVLLEMFVVARCLVVARRTPDAFGRIVCAAVAGWLGFQTLENVGMNLGLMPVTGVPLPFVSYGGSSLFACWIAVGLVGNVHAAQQRRIS